MWKQAPHAMQSPESMLKAVAVSQLVGDGVGHGLIVLVKVELMQMLKPSSL